MRFLTRAVFIVLLASPAAMALAPGCGGSSSTNGTNSGGSGGAGSGTGAGLNASGSGAGATTGSNSGSTSGTMSTGTMTGGGPCVQVECNGHVYECGDCLDNDGDGLVDSADPDCLGPCDNTENSYFGGIPGANNAGCKMDCYFDQDTGAGNDDCYWDHRCDFHEVAPNYYPEHDNGSKCEYNADPNFIPPASPYSCSEMYNAQSATCQSYCGPLTPNGCDCFGCCELPAGSGKYIWLGSTINGVGSCDIANIADPTKCQPCQPVKACLNTCEHCELCLGKDTLPPDCSPPDGGPSTTSSGSTTSGTTTGSGGGGQCAPDVQPCGLPGQSPCAAGTYCITGCCQPIPK